MSRRAVVAALAGAALWLAAVCAPAEAPWSSGASSGEDLVIKLVTIDPSVPIYTWWGHTALIVEDRRLRLARFYNYGLFSFEADNFVLNFARGRLWFQVGAASASRELEYEKAFDRGIRLQTLALPPADRLALARALEHDILPENRVYLYEHYSDNCATRVRDQIDRAAGGRLAAVGGEPGRMTLREHTRRYTSRSFLMDWLLMFLMSGVIDAPITRWEEMFLPAELERNVRLVRLPDGTGGERPLVAEEVVYHEPLRPHLPPERPPAHWPAGAAIGAGLGLLALLLGWGARRGRPAVESAFAAYSALVGCVLGTLGTALFLMAAFTDHTVTYGNENLFLASPLTLVGLPLGLLALRRGPRRPARGRWLARLWCALTGLALLYGLVKLAALALGLPALVQRNELAAATILPLLLGLASGSLVGFPGCLQRSAPRSHDSHTAG